MPTFSCGPFAIYFQSFTIRWSWILIEFFFFVFRNRYEFITINFSSRSRSTATKRNEKKKQQNFSTHEFRDEQWTDYSIRKYERRWIIIRRSTNFLSTRIVSLLARTHPHARTSVYRRCRRLGLCEFCVCRTSATSIAVELVSSFLHYIDTANRENQGRNSLVRPSSP